MKKGLSSYTVNNKLYHCIIIWHKYGTVTKNNIKLGNKNSIMESTGLTGINVSTKMTHMVVCYYVERNHCVDTSPNKRPRRASFTKRLHNFFVLSRAQGLGSGSRSVCKSHTEVIQLSKHVFIYFISWLNTFCQVI